MLPMNLYLADVFCEMSCRCFPLVLQKLEIEDSYPPLPESGLAPEDMTDDETDEASEERYVNDPTRVDENDRELSDEEHDEEHDEEEDEEDDKENAGEVESDDEGEDDGDEYVVS